MAEFMTDEDLEALKTAADPETANAGQDNRLQVRRGNDVSSCISEHLMMSVAEEASCFVALALRHNTVTACIFNSLPSQYAQTCK